MLFISYLLEPLHQQKEGITFQCWDSSVLNPERVKSSHAAFSYSQDKQQFKELLFPHDMLVKNFIQMQATTFYKLLLLGLTISLSTGSPQMLDSCTQTQVAA